MKKWILFLIKYIFVGLIGFVAILYLIPEGQNPSFSLNQLNPENIDFNELADIFKSFATNINHNLNVPQHIVIDNGNTGTDNIPQEDKGETKQKWAVVSSPVAAYYTKNGKFAGHLKPGELLIIIKRVFTKKGIILVCKRNNQPDTVPFLTKPEYVIIHNGNIEKTNNELMSLYIEYARTTAEISDLKNKQKNKLRSDNPFAREYAIAKKEYVEYWKKVKELTAKRDNSTESKSIEYGDQLRKMRSDAVTIENNLKKAKEDYDTWNTIHPAIVNSKELNKLLTKQKDIEKIIKEKENK